MSRVSGYNPTEQEVRSILKDELGGREKIDFEEFSKVVQKRKKPAELSSDPQIQEAFKVFDKNGSGNQ
jgi:Ca2+-binding EF-hand superfamily protein